MAGPRPNGCRSRPPPRIFAVVPEDQRRAIQFATDRPRFGITPLGTSHGFDPAGDLTSFVVWINSRGILVDPSPEALVYLEQSGVAPVDIPYVFLTHIHADHDGGLVEKLLNGGRTTVIASDPVFRTFVEKARLITAHDFKREGLIHHVAANPGAPVTIEIGGETATLETRWNLHSIPTNGFKLSFGGRTFGYSADTQYDPSLLTRLREQGKLSEAFYHDLMYFFWTTDGRPKVDLLYHEAGIPPIHTDKEKLQALPEPLKARMRLVHIADKDVPKSFIPRKPRLFVTRVLLPRAARLRQRILLETLSMVCYLYDVPSETLKELIRGGEVCQYETDEVIIHQGQVPKGELLHFYVIADGEVAVKDGRRLIAKLVKSDSFGEWGISHQRGFRAADVVAARPCQCLRFTEAQFRWLVERYPVILERIGKVRSLLPRLQFAQARARLRAGQDQSGPRSVIADMDTGQLSGFAIFSEVRGFREGQPVITEGDEADGFYILLSGHLAATVGGRVVGELSEGEVFGEMGLLESGKRSATVPVVSADAEVLFMSTQNFHALLHTVPAFSWSIREIAAQRRGVNLAPKPHH
ncbi:MAG: cyclic nucleotide-binding domain-containing protein [Nitrospinae bacterium]|nr:cyclic nucleotide-binding domain-containing protein [Nitrospinota bacterium]